MVSSPTKKVKADDGHAQLPNLPTSLLLRVVQFASNDSMFYVPDGPAMHSELLKTLGQVSLPFAQAVKNVHRELDERILRFKFRPGNSNDASRLYREVERRGRRLQTLKLEVWYDSNEARRRFFEAIESGNRPRTLNPISNDELKDVDVDWTRVFKSCPGLEWLGLRSVPIDCGHLPQILKAASTHCRNLHALILPDLAELDSESTGKAMMASVLSALQSWYEKGNRQGLRVLELPSRPQFEDDEVVEDAVANTNEYLNALAAYCPNLEWWRHSIDYGGDFLSCKELLYCDKRTWQTFCSRCTHLREFDWYLFPQIDDFFQIFAKFPKPNLKRLTIGCGDNVDYGMEDGDYYEDGDWECTSEGLASIFQACPNLEDLRVFFSSEDEEQERQELFTDEMFEWLAANCPKLHTLKLAGMDNAQEESVLTNLTDVGFMALATLPALHRMRIKNSHCSALGVFALLCHAPTSKEGGRKVELKITATDVTNFSELVVDLLTLLMEHATTLECEDRCFALELHNFEGGHDMIDRLGATLEQWEASFPQFQVTTFGELANLDSIQILHRWSKPVDFDIEL